MLQCGSLLRHAPCDCLQVDRRFDEISEIVCFDDPTGGGVIVCFNYTFQLTSLFGQDGYHSFLGSLGAETFSPDYFDLVAINPGPLGNGQSVLLTTKITSAVGAQTGGLIEFLITVHNEDLSECCSRVHSVLVPDCDVPPVMTGPMGDVNEDGVVNFLDVTPFVDLITSGGFHPKADINQDGVVSLLDVAPFVALLSGG